MTRSVARLLAESLEAHDVDQIFCVPGESYVGLINALTDMNSLRLIVCRHEGGAGFMAVAEAGCAAAPAAASSRAGPDCPTRWCRCIRRITTRRRW